MVIAVHDMLLGEFVALYSDFLTDVFLVYALLKEKADSRDSCKLGK